MSATVFNFPVKDEVAEDAAGPMRINLGCNKNALPGYVNVDIENYPGVDVVADLEKRWPWDDNSVDEIYTADLPEHLRGWYEEPDPEMWQKAREYFDKYRGSSKENTTILETAVNCMFNAISRPKRTYGILHFMNEAWRVLKPGGLLKARIPTTESKAWAQDPTHVSFWNENTLLYFTHPQYRAIYPRDIKANFEPVEVRTLMQNMYGEAWVMCVLKKIA